MSYKTNCLASSTDHQCRAQVDLFDTMTDSILLNLLDVSDINHPKYDATKFGGVGWISINTNSNSGLGDTWSQLNTNNTHINMLILQQYNPEDSKLIFDSLDSTPIGSGIVFDHQGNLALLDSSNKNKIIYNQLIPTENRNTANLDATQVDQTIRGKRGKYMLGAQGGQLGGNVYFISKSIVMNPQLTFILYTKDKTPTEKSIYYLLYNPIHRKPFQDYYRSLLEFNAPTGGWINDNLFNPGANRGYQEGNITALSQKKGGASKIAPGFKSIMSKYCNAFKIGNIDTLPNGYAAEHYADPSCTLALSAEDAQLSFILSSNYTQSNLAYRVWASENGSKDNGNAGYLNAQKIFQGNPGYNAMYWPCDVQQSQTAASAYNFCRTAGVLGDNSTSFLTVLANAYVNSFKGISENPVPLNNRAPNNQKKPGCKQVAQNIITCQNNLTIAGDASHNKIGMSSACGLNTGKGKSSDPKKSSTTTPTSDSTSDSTSDPTSDPTDKPITKPTSDPTDTPVTPISNHPTDPTADPTADPTTKLPIDYKKYIPAIVLILLLLFIFAFMYFK